MMSVVQSQEAIGEVSTAYIYRLLRSKVYREPDRCTRSCTYTLRHDVRSIVGVSLRTVIWTVANRVQHELRQLLMLVPVAIRATDLRFCNRNAGKRQLFVKLHETRLATALGLCGSNNFIGSEKPTVRQHADLIGDQSGLVSLRSRKPFKMLMLKLPQHDVQLPYRRHVGRVSYTHLTSKPVHHRYPLARLIRIAGYPHEVDPLQQFIRLHLAGSSMRNHRMPRGYVQTFSNSQRTGVDRHARDLQSETEISA